jgi:hypothetical protein
MNYSTLIIFALFFTVIGFITALLITRLREPEQTRLDRKITDWRIPDPNARPGTLQVWKDPQSNGLFIELDGQVYRSVEQLSPDQRRMLTTLTGSLVDWLGQVTTEPPPPVERQASVSMPASAPKKLTPAQPPSSSGPLRRAFQSGGKKEHIKLITPAAQIDATLQEKLVSSPLAHRNIRLVDLPDHGLAVEVDQEQFDGIDDVPEEAVRKLLKDAVAEWQRRSTSGRL